MRRGVEELIWTAHGHSKILPSSQPEIRGSEHRAGDRAAGTTSLQSGIVSSRVVNIEKHRRSEHSERLAVPEVVR